jgi:hypothetical protein
MAAPRSGHGRRGLDRRGGGRDRPRGPRRWRALAWWYTGPAGHLVAGALDVGALLVRLLWAKARGQRVEWL